MLDELVATGYVRWARIAKESGQAVCPQCPCGMTRVISPAFSPVVLRHLEVRDALRRNLVLDELSNSSVGNPRFWRLVLGKIVTHRDDQISLHLTIKDDKRP